MRVLVTGASGFVGQHLCRLLVRRGHSVLALVRPSSNRAGLQDIGVRFVQGDLATGRGLDGAVIEADWVFHLGALTKARSEREFFDVNAAGTQRLLEALNRRPPPPKLIFCSSLAAMGPTQPGRPLKESDLAAPISAYGRSKLQAEGILRASAGEVPSVIVRPAIVYGPRDHELLPTMVPMLKAGLMLKSGFRRKEYSFVHVADLCDALVAAAERGRTLVPADPLRGVYLVSDGGTYAWEEVCRLMGKAWGKPNIPVLSVPEWAGYPALALSQLQRLWSRNTPAITMDKLRELSADAWTCEMALAAEELGFAPAFELERGLQETVRWYQAQPGT